MTGPDTSAGGAHPVVPPAEVLQSDCSALQADLTQAPEARHPRCWAEVDLNAIASNLRAIGRAIPDASSVMAVVKADAYGHGLPSVVRSAVGAGVTQFGVATAAEAGQVHASAHQARAVLLSPPAPGDEYGLVAQGSVVVVSGMSTVNALSRAASASGRAAQVHIEVDTGMGRAGVLPHEVAEFARAIGATPGISLTGLMTHFPCSESDRSLTLDQTKTLCTLAGDLRRHCPQIVLHAANSAAIMTLPETHLDTVRPGLLTYGIVPDLCEDLREDAQLRAGLRPALSLRARVVLTRSVPAGHPISYGQTHRTATPSRLAIVSCGYGDGYPRGVGGAGHVLIHGIRAPIVGRICMDVMTVDITGIGDVACGSVATLIGDDGHMSIRTSQVARWAATTEHDVTTRLTVRVPRLYFGR